MSHLTKLKEILDGQAERGIRSGDWGRLDYEITSKKDTPVLENFIKLNIDNLKVAFVFSPKGRLIGAYNYKE